ncbi:MAG: peptidoglycan DD-metalloendopeptidase family protein [bacterium]|nr:peptidoglycan DD-metalloendopeptidase family protein [bacterium]
MTETTFWAPVLKTGVRVLAAIVLLVGVFGSTSMAQEKDSGEERSRLQSLKDQLREKLSFFRKLEGEEKGLVAELKKIDKSLKKQQEQLDNYKERFRTHNSELKELEADIQQLEKKHQQNKSTLAKRLRAIYKMGDLGYLTPLFAMSAHANVQQQLKYLQGISESDRRLIAGAQKEMQTLLRQKKTLQTQKGEVARAEKELKEHVAKIHTQQQEKTRVLQKITRDKKQYVKLIRGLENSAGELDSYIKKLEKQQKQRPDPPAPTEIQGEEVVFPSNASNMSYAEHFRSNKGKLLWPVEGKIITRFGPMEIDNTYTHYNGVDIRAERGAPFYAVFKGRIKYADWFQDYGRLIIIDHGGGFYSLYAHAEELTVKSGEMVETRQLLGRVGDTDSIKGAHLYFEVRVKGKPNDPKKWLAKLR